MSRNWKFWKRDPRFSALSSIVKIEVLHAFKRFSIQKSFANFSTVSKVSLLQRHIFLEPNDFFFYNNVSSQKSLNRENNQRWFANLTSSWLEWYSSFFHFFYKYDHVLDGVQVYNYLNMETVSESEMNILCIRLFLPLTTSHAFSLENCAVELKG